MLKFVVSILLGAMSVPAPALPRYNVSILDGDSQPMALNNLGVAIGTVRDVASIYSEAGSIPLDLPAQYTASWAMATNDNNVIVGVARPSSGLENAFIYMNGYYRDLSGPEH